MSEPAKHVIVVGAGIVGLNAAHYLRERGHDVTVIDRAPAERATTSFGNQGMVVPSHFVPLAAPGVVWQGVKLMADPKSPFYVRPRLSTDLASWGLRFWLAGTKRRVEAAAPVLLALNRASKAEWVKLDAELGGGFSFEQRGLNMLAATEQGLEAEARTAEFAHRLGLPAQVLDRAGVQALEPGIELNVVGGVHYPEDAHLDPAAFMRVMTRHLAAAGVGFRYDTNVTGFDTAGDRVVSVRTDTMDGTRVISVDHVVLAAGSWSPELGSELGLRLLMQPGKGYSMTVERPTQRLATPSILSEAHVAVTRMGERLRVGGTMELAGFDDGPGETRVAGITEAALRYFPRLTKAELDDTPRWHGFRPCSPDGLPYLGRSPHQRNVTVATGHAMSGVSLAPVSGKLVAELVAGEEPSIDLTLLRPDRYA